MMRLDYWPNDWYKPADRMTKTSAEWMNRAKLIYYWVWHLTSKWWFWYFCDYQVVLNLLLIQICCCINIKTEYEFPLHISSIYYFFTTFRFNIASGNPIQQWRENLPSHARSQYRHRRHRCEMVRHYIIIISILSNTLLYVPIMYVLINKNAANWKKILLLPK